MRDGGHSSETKLAQDLERARRAQAAAGTLALIGNALTLGSQVALAAQSLGSNALDGIKSATSPDELRGIVDKVATNLGGNADKTMILYKQSVSNGTQIRKDLLIIIRREGTQRKMCPRFPCRDVPADLDRATSMRGFMTVFGAGRIKLQG